MHSETICPTTRALRLPRVCDLTGLSRASVWRLSREDPHFPKPFRLSHSTTAWDEQEIVSWIETRKLLRGV